MAAFGTLYLCLTSRDGVGPATHAFAITTAAFAEVALLATATAALTTRQGPYWEIPRLRPASRT